MQDAEHLSKQNSEWLSPGGARTQTNAAIPQATCHRPQATFRYISVYFRLLPEDQHETLALKTSPNNPEANWRSSLPTCVQWCG